MTFFELLNFAAWVFGGPVIMPRNEADWETARRLTVYTRWVMQSAPNRVLPFP